MSSFFFFPSAFQHVLEFIEGCARYLQVRNESIISSQRRGESESAATSQTAGWPSLSKLPILAVGCGGSQELCVGFGTCGLVGWFSGPVANLRHLRILPVF